eukprot:evm.model.NODE_11327_length_113420_cov_67.305626.13
MLVETDVKVKEEAGIGYGSGSSESDNRSGKSGSAAADASEGTGPPPVPVDTFRHKSLADVPTDYGPYLTIKGFKINAFGFYFCFMALFWAIPWGVFLILYKASLEFMDKIDPRRYNVDRSSALWGWLTSISTDSLPEITGTENIPKGPAVFVANHASWMDVPYTAQLPVRAKYLAKADLAKIPILGNAMSMAKHVLLDRDDKRSQMEALRSALLILKTGTPIFVFPEGTRGPQGRMQTFKMGAFKVATKAGVPIVPVSIAGTHVMMPKEVIMPQCAGRGITAIHVHPPISTKGRTDQELSDLAFNIINNALSDEQRALSSTKKDDSGA